MLFRFYVIGQEVWCIMREYGRFFQFGYKQKVVFFNQRGDERDIYYYIRENVDIFREKEVLQGIVMQFMEQGKVDSYGFMRLFLLISLYSSDYFIEYDGGKGVF